MNKKNIFIIIFLLIFYINSFAAENTQTQTPAQTQPQPQAQPQTQQSTAQQEAEALRRREEAIRRREEALRQRERAIQQREQGRVRVHDATGMQAELRRREQARRERERLRRRDDENREFTSKHKYSAGLYMGMSYLVNPSEVDNSENSLFGISFGANFLYAIDNEYHIKVGIDISYATKLMKFTDNNYSPAYDVTTRGLFILFQGRYDFLSRKDGHRFVPFANVYLGLLLPNEESTRSIVVTFGAGGGFDFWVTKEFGVFLQVRVLMAKMNALPESTYCKDKYQVWLYPCLGATFSF